MRKFLPLNPNLPQRDAVFSQLRTAIANGDLFPGEKIVETVYADIFNVSRTPVREALHMLEQTGLVEYHPQKGCYVRPLPSIDEVEEVYQIRSALEVMAAESLVNNITAEAINKLDSYNAKCQKAIERDDPIEYYANIDAFNELQITVSKMPLLSKILDFIEVYQPGSSFEDGGASMLKSLTYTPERRKATLEEHICILDAIKAKDLDALKKAITRHLENSKEANIIAYREYQKIIDQNEQFYGIVKRRSN